MAFSASLNNDPSDFQPSNPLRSLSNHRAAINAIEIGHSVSKSNIAVSASEDSTCIVWDFIEGTLLRTFLLPSIPLCLTLDPVDRGFCAGYSDGSIQLVDFYTNRTLTHAMYDPAQHSMPTQPPSSDRWSAPEGLSSPALTIQYSYDGTVLLSGHENGIIQMWNAASGGQSGDQTIDLGAPVTNLKVLPPTGFSLSETPLLKTNNVTRPRYENIINGLTTSSTSQFSIPMDYTFTAQLLPLLPATSPPTLFDQALTSPLFAPSLISASLSFFNTNNNNNDHLPSNQAPATFSNASNLHERELELEHQNKLLYTQLETALENQRKAIKQVLQLERERHERAKLDERKASRKRKRRLWRLGIEQRRREEVMMMMEKNDGMVVDDDEKRRGGEISQEISKEKASRNISKEGTSDDEDEDELSSTTDDFTD